MPFVKFTLEKGVFTASDTSAVYTAFAIYILTLPAITMGAIIAQGFYVLQDTRTPAISTVFQVIIYFIVCILLLPKINYLAIPVAYCLYSNFALFLNGFIVRYKLGGEG